MWTVIKVYNKSFVTKELVSLIFGVTNLGWKGKLKAQLSVTEYSWKLSLLFNTGVECDDNSQRRTFCIIIIHMKPMSIFVDIHN